MRLYNDFKGSDVTFQMTPAVRGVDRPCIEETNCNWELATVCAFNQTNTTGKVNFLACMDEKAMVIEVVGTQVALNAAKKCAPAASVDVQELETCYKGPDGQQLLEAASKVFNAQFPGATSVPHTFVNTDHVQADYADLKSALCSAGSTAKVCSGMTTSCTV